MDVIDDAAARRFELATEAGPAFAAYSRGDGTITFTHTVVPPAVEGHGIGGCLIAGALARVRADGLRVVARCPFVAAYVDGHPEWRDLLA